MKRSLVWLSVGLAGIMVMVAGCSSDDDALAETDKRLDEITAATIDLDFAATSVDDGEEAPPIGFRLEGPFSFDTDAAYPLLDLSYTRRLGETSEEARVTSTGDAVFVDGRRVDDDAAGSLRLAEGDDDAGLEHLALRDWVDDAAERRDGDVDVITGRVDVAEAFSDLARLASQLGAAGDSALDELDDEDRKRLADLVEQSEITVTTGHDDRLLRSVDMRVDLAPGPSDDDARLRSLLGARITFRLALSDVNQPVEIDDPSD